MSDQVAGIPFTPGGGGMEHVVSHSDSHIELHDFVNTLVAERHRQQYRSCLCLDCQAERGAAS